MKNYLGDMDSKEFAVYWNGIIFITTKVQNYLTRKKSVIRLGLVQWQMRQLNNLDALFEQCEFFLLM
jgi:hypothetical protein